MSINPEALQKLLIEMDNQLNKSKAELSICHLQLDKVNSNLSIIDKSSKSLSKVCDLESKETVWQGIGKAFVAKDVNDYLKEIEGDKKEFQETKESLAKKQHYLETTLKNTLENMNQIVNRPKQ